MACHDLIPVKGTRFFIGDKTKNEVGLAYTEVGMIESFGEFGPDASVGSFTPVGTGVAGKYMGTTDNGELTLTIAKTSTDTGLQEMIAAQKGRVPLAYKVLLANDADSYVFNGLCRLVRVSIGNSDDVVKINCAIAITGAIGLVDESAVAFGGDEVVDYIENSVAYRAHIFTTSGDFVTDAPMDVEYLVVAGGGGGGYNAGGGGGAGGLLTNVGEAALALMAGTYPVVIGAGGPGNLDGAGNGGNGSNSTALSLTAVGGGGGASASSAGASGGSGGGAGQAEVATWAGGAGTENQGNDGGGTTSSSNRTGGAGGGGAGGVGASIPSNEDYGGDGGIGLLSAMTGISTYYAGGGGGGSHGVAQEGVGGLGGGGNGGDRNNSIAATDGGANTGGGGGGGASANVLTGANGGSGIVVIRYARSA